MYGYIYTHSCTLVISIIIVLQNIYTHICTLLKSNIKILIKYLIIGRNQVPAVKVYLPTVVQIYVTYSFTVLLSIILTTCLYTLFFTDIIYDSKFATYVYTLLYAANI